MRAFTLFETLLLIIISTILIFTGVATWLHLINRNRLDSQANHLIRAIRFSRSAAITRNTRVTFCGSKDGKSCDGHWTAGQIIFEDLHKNILYEYGKLPKKYHLTWQSSLGRDDFLQFEPDGFTNGQQGNFKLWKENKESNTDHSSGLTITVLRSGRLVVEK